MRHFETVVFSESNIVTVTRRLLLS